MTNFAPHVSFLQLVACHPWASVRVLQAMGALDARTFKQAMHQTLAVGWVEQARLPGPRRAARLLALTPQGAGQLGLAYSLTDYRTCLMQNFRLELARAHLHAWCQTATSAWAFSPYILSARAFSLATGQPKTQMGKRTGGSLQTLHLDGLACLQLEPQRFALFALMVDIDGIKLDSLRQQFRSLAAWRRHWAQTERRAEALVTVVVTTPHRWPQGVLAWREGIAKSETVRPLRLIGFEPGAEGLARNERAEAAPLWAGLSLLSSAIDLPTQLLPKTHQKSTQAYRRSNRPRLSVLSWAARFKTPWAQLVQLHQTLGVWARQVLERIGQYPLLTGKELAVILGRSAQHVAHASRILQHSQLIERPAGQRGWVLTTLGLKFLATQAGYSPAQYASLRGWPTRGQANHLQYSPQVWLQTLAHTRLILQFLVGLRRYGPTAGVQLRHWEHVHTHQTFSSTPAAHLLPDAIGILEVNQDAPRRELTFWLEVDRGTVRGQALTHKLARYWEAIQWGRRVRLLMVVETEARLQAVRRRLRQLALRHAAWVDVRLTRVDMLHEPSGHLNPFKRVWRTATHSHFISAFGVDQ